MKLSRRLIALLMVLGVTMLMFAGCKNTMFESPGYKKPDDFPTVDSSLVAENSRFNLTFDNNRKCLILEDKTDGKKWGTIPYEFYETDTPNANIDSPLFIEYVDKTDGTVHPAKAYSASITMETVSCEKIKNGLKIKFYFDDQKIMIPVTYTLRDNSLAIGIDPKEIQEGSNRISKVSIAPFMCSAQNSVPGNYLFIPSGSGALMFADESSSGTRAFAGEMFGLDPAKLVSQNATNEIPLLLPVFGAKEGKHALLSIIESGEGMAIIEANAGNNRNHYSNVYATFNLLGSDTVEADVSWSTADVHVMADSITSNETITVGYYPLNGEDANYVGMAKQFRNYMQNSGLMKTERSKDPVYGVSLLGGAMVKKHFFGIPYESLFVTTNYSQSQNIINELATDLEIAPIVNMKGFGETGLDPGKVAGNFRFAKQLGSNSQRMSLEKTIKDMKTSIFWDFDLINFKKSGNGFSSIFNTAKTANGQMAYQYILSKSLHGIDESENEDRYMILNRGSLLKAGEKLLHTAEKKKITGIGLGSLGSIAYSDFGDEAYYSKGNIDADTATIMKSLSDANVKVAVNQANGYAAALADCIFDAPMHSASHDAFDVDVPFYQIVFKGFVPMVSNPVNLAHSGRKQVLKSIESGTALGFALMSDYDVILAETYHHEFYGALYDDNKQYIKDVVKECEDYYKAIYGASIKEHYILSGNVTKTVFDNGVIVFTNQGSQTVELPEGTIKAEEFIFAKGGAS